MARADDYVEMSATCFIESFERRIKSYPWNRCIDGTLYSHMYDSEDALYDAILQRIPRTQKFVLGSIGNFDHDDHWHHTDQLADTAKDFFSNGIKILPYPECWFEWDWWGKSHSGAVDVAIGKGSQPGKTVCIAYEDHGGIVFQTFFSNGVSDRKSLSEQPWYLSGAVIYLRQDTGEWEWWTCCDDPATYFDYGKDNPAGPWNYDGWDDYEIGKPTAEDWRSVDRCLASMAMLLARETKTVERQPPASLNAHRVKKGKVPLFSHHVVTIDPQRIVYESGDGSQPGGAKRTSPRLHWRRGHVRTLSSGKKVGIPPSIIGAKNGGGGGVIDKTYRVRTDHVQN